jgi:hypothetical protein
MATRDSIPLGLSWVHVDMTHSRADIFLANAETKCAERVPGATMSVNTKIDGTEALVKVTVDTDYFATLPANIQEAIIQVFSADDHYLALAMVRTEAWQGPPPPL